MFQERKARNKLKMKRFILATLNFGIAAGLVTVEACKPCCGMEEHNKNMFIPSAIVLWTISLIFAGLSGYYKHLNDRKSVNAELTTIKVAPNSRRLFSHKPIDPNQLPNITSISQETSQQQDNNPIATARNT